MDDKVQNVIYLVKQSPLDQTIKDILVRDLSNEGLSDFLREQIKAYCLEGINELDGRIAQAKKILDAQSQSNPA